MPLDWKQWAIDQLDWYWQMSLRPRLTGMTDDEYFWEPVPGCWSIRPRATAVTRMAAGKGDLVIDFEFPEPTPTPVTTIAWRLGHIGSGVLGFRADNHFGRGAPNFDEVEWPASAEAAIAYVEDGYARWMAGAPERIHWYPPRRKSPNSLGREQPRKKGVYVTSHL